MKFGLDAKEPTGWKYEAWRSCKDVNLPEINGVPRYLRCMRCYRLVTHGEIAFGACICGYRKLNPANGLTWMEILLLKLGWFPMKDWEVREIRPLIPSILFPVRNKILRVKPPSRMSITPKDLR